MVSSSRSSSASSTNSKGSVKSWRSGSSTVTVESDDVNLPRNKAVEALIYLSGGRPSRHRNLRKCRIITEYDDAGSYAGSSRGSSASFRRKEVVQWFFVGDRYEPWLVEVDDDDDRSHTSRHSTKKAGKSRGGRDNRPPPAAARNPGWGRPGPQNGPQQHPPPPHNQHHMHMEEEIIDDDDDSSSYMSDEDYGWTQPPPPPMGPPMGMGMGMPPMNRAPPMNPHMGGPVPPMPGPARTPVPETGDGGEPLFFKLN